MCKILNIVHFGRKTVRSAVHNAFRHYNNGKAIPIAIYAPAAFQQWERRSPLK